MEDPVTTGQKLRNLMEITSGLKEGDKVIGKVDEQNSSRRKGHAKNQIVARVMDRLVDSSRKICSSRTSATAWKSRCCAISIWQID